METFTREHMAQAEGPFSSEVVVDELDDEIFVTVLVCCYEPNDEDEFIRESTSPLNIPARSSRSISRRVFAARQASPQRLASGS